eukprot:scaffold80816_cov18-Tisochrysis_lutea.AAC.1
MDPESNFKRESVHLKGQCIRKAGVIFFGAESRTSGWRIGSGAQVNGLPPGEAPPPACQPPPPAALCLVLG